MTASCRFHSSVFAPGGFGARPSFEKKSNGYSFDFTPAWALKTPKPNFQFTPSWAAQSTKSSPKFNFTFIPPKTCQARVATAYSKSVEPVAQVSSKEGSKVVFSPLVLSGAEVIADFSGHVRQTFSSAHAVYGTENPAALASLGFTNSFSVISGGLGVKSGIKEAREAKKISDVAGTAIACLKVGKNAASAAGGAIMVPFEALSIAALSTASKIVSTMAGVLGSIGGALFSVGSLLAAIATGIRLNEFRVFDQTLNKILNDPAGSEEQRNVLALEHLKNLARVTPEERRGILEELEKDPALTGEQKREKAVGKEKALLEKKEVVLKRVTGKECLEKIRKSTPAEAAEVIAAVQKKRREKTILTSVTMALLVLGVALAAASFIFTGPLAIIVITSLALAVSLGSLSVDAYALVQDFKKGDPGRFDKLWIFLSTVLAIVAVGVVFFLTGGLAPLIGAGVVGLVWLAINSACYYRLTHLKNQKTS